MASLFVSSGAQRYRCQCAFIHIIWMFLVSMYILPWKNIAVFDIVYLFPRHDSTGTRVWVYPILFLGGAEPEHLSKDKLY